MSDAPDMNDLLAQAMQMQQAMMQAQQDAAARTVEGVSGGGVVRVEVSGTMEFLHIHIDPRVIDPADPSMLEDLVLAAIHDAAAKVAQGQQEAMGSIGGGMLGGLLG
jgi:nucleoid-associated protein EbfC